MQQDVHHKAADTPSGAAHKNNYGLLQLTLETEVYLW